MHKNKLNRHDIGANGQHKYCRETMMNYMHSTIYSCNCTFTHVLYVTYVPVRSSVQGTLYVERHEGAVLHHRVDQLAAIATSNNQRELPANEGFTALPYQVTRFTLYLYPNISQLVQYCIL